MSIRFEKLGPLLCAGVLCVTLAGCGGGSGNEESRQAVTEQRIKDDASAAKKQVDELKGITMRGGELSGGDAQGRPLWRISAKEIRVFNEQKPEKEPATDSQDGEEGGADEKEQIKDEIKKMSEQPKRAQLKEARAMIYKNGKLDSTFVAPLATVNYTPQGARIVMTGGITAQSAGGWTGERGAVSLMAPRADVNVKNRTVWASGGVRMTQGKEGQKVYAAANQVRADASLQTTRLSGGVKASSPRGQFSAQEAAWNWQTNRASASGNVTAVHEGTTITGARLDADTAAGRGTLSGGVRASGKEGKASASTVRYDWQNHTIVASGGVLLDKGEASLQAGSISADDKFDAAVATGGVTLKKGDATLRAGRVETRGKGESATASGGVTLVSGDGQVTASRATATNLGSDNVSVTASGDVRVRRGDVTITAGSAQASGLKDKSTLRVVGSGGVYAKSTDGAVRASRATYGGGKIVASGGVTLYREGHQLSGERLVCDDKFNQATLTGGISGRMAKGQTMSAGRIDYRKGQGIVATQGVSARRGELRLRADKLTSTPTGTDLVLTGNVVVVSDDGTRILAREVRYDRGAQKVYAAGDVYLQDPKRGLRQRGRKLVADLKLKQATLTEVSGSGKMDVFKDKKLF